MATKELTPVIAPLRDAFMESTRPEEEKDIDPAKLPKTTGEKYYDVVQFMTGKAWIMVFSAIMAYVARYGKDQYGPVPNVFKKAQVWFENKLLHNKVFPLGEKGEVGARIAGASASTTVLMWGGNLFAPIMKKLENNREAISNYFNRKFGQPGEEEIAHERLKDLHQQTWGDILKGRFVGWFTVCATFLGMDALIGKNAKTGQYGFDAYEEWVARGLAGLTKKGKALNIGLPGETGIPLHQKLTSAQEASKTYRFGKMVALDVFATSAAILIWNTVSRLSAKQRHEKNIANGQLPPISGSEAVNEPDTAETRYTDKFQSKGNTVANIRKTQAPEPYLSKVSLERTLDNTSSPGIV